MIIKRVFSPAVIEKLDYYVYLLIDPEINEVFYVGKGTGNRIFAHLNQALLFPDVSDKLDKIREIQSRGYQVRHVIHRHGLTEKEAYEVEASLIDFIGLTELTNLVHGHYTSDRGPMTIAEVFAQYDAPKIVITEPVILIILNKSYKRGISDEKLYEITCGNWVIGKRRNNAKYAFSVYHGIVRQVYEIQRWFPVSIRTQAKNPGARWRFDGVIALHMQHYVGGSVENYLTAGSQNPIKYINC